MIYPDVPLEEWAKRYRIDLTPVECSRCKKPQMWSRPIAFDGYRGIEAELHECGEKYRSSRVVPFGEREISIWKLLLS